MGSTPRHEQRRGRRTTIGRSQRSPAVDPTIEVREGRSAQGTARIGAATNGSGNGGGRPPRIPKPAASGRRGKPRLRKLRTALVLLGLSLLAFVSWIFGIMMAVAQDLPALENRAQFARAQNPIVYDVNGEEIATLTNNEGRILLPSEDIASTMKEAVVAVEDARFYSHRGVDYQGIARAVYQDMIARSATQGASTITQQFVKNALEAQDSRTIFQKLREAALAYHLERQWSKDKILTEYLNSIYFGEGAYGIEAAARTFFGSEHEGCGEIGGACASELRPHEAALLAGMISSPSAHDPIANPDEALERRNFVLQRMAEQGYITESEYGDYAEIPLPEEKDVSPPDEDSEAPYFTSWLRQQLVDRYGPGQAFGGGLEVHSTLDLELQREVEEIVSTRLSGIEPTAAVVVLDNDTAGVLAMVGGSDFDEVPFNLATQGSRQPGSAFKPFTLITALEEGHTTGEVFTSAEQALPFKSKVPKENGRGMKVVNELFEVANYEDSYLGSASLATATTYSDNAVYTQLGMQVGPADIARTAHRMGIESDLRSENRYAVDDSGFQRYNPALILGGLTNGVTPLEMTHAYLTIAQDGYRMSGTMAGGEGGVVGINKVTKQTGDEQPNPGGNPVETNDGTSGENEVASSEVVDPSAAAETQTLLESVVSGGTGTNAASSAADEVWGKTGTTDDNGDAWFCGGDADITACVWVGHPDGRVPMETEYAGQPVDGGTYPALIFSDLVTAWEELLDARGEDDDEGDDGDEETEEDLEAPLEPEAPVETEPELDAPAEDGTDAPANESGGGGGDGGAPSPTEGGGAASPP